jgi:hypothetical protein
MIGAKVYRKKDTFSLSAKTATVLLNHHSGERGIVQPDCIRNEASTNYPDC